MRVDEEGYSPAILRVNGEPLVAEWQSPLEVYWNFGDSDFSVFTGDRVSVSHQYADDGEYTVTVTVRDRQGVFATATKTVQVVNTDPADVRIAAVEIDPTARSSSSPRRRSTHPGIRSPTTGTSATARRRRARISGGRCTSTPGPAATRSP